MGQKVHPGGLRVGVIHDWKSNWMVSNKEFAGALLEDLKIRKHIIGELSHAGLSDILIRKDKQRITIDIYTARPGIVIGKSGVEVDALRKEVADLRTLAANLKMWLVLGSAHFLDENAKPTNCLYLIDLQGEIVDRYDKSFCTEGDQKYYSAGNRLVTHEIQGVKVGLAICYDICWPQLYIAYRKMGVTVMIHSIYNAGDKGKNCLDTLNNREVPTRCADNRLWAVANNSSKPYSHWGSFIARPDATIAKELEINKPGMLVHDFPDSLAPDGWYHNHWPMEMAENTIMTWGTPSDHPRQRDGQSEP